MKLTIIITLVVLALATVGLVLYYTPGSATAPHRGYAERLAALKSVYRNKDWPSRSGPQVVGIFDTLIVELTAAGEGAPKDTRVACFQRASAALHEVYRTKRPIDGTEAQQLRSLGHFIAMTAGVGFAEDGNAVDLITIDRK
jgi:hypothetical protein